VPQIRVVSFYEMLVWLSFVLSLCAATSSLEVWSEWENAKLVFDGARFPDYVYFGEKDGLDSLKYKGYAVCLVK